MGPRPSRKFLIIAFAVVLLDQGSKYLVKTFLPPGTMLELIPGLFSLVHVNNTGVAFGLWANHSQTLRYLLSGVNLWAVLILFWLARKGTDKTALACGLIAGGALGNLIDRIRQGHVLDFLDFHWGPYHWPAFNLADSAITIGVFIMLLLSLRQD